MNRPKQLKILFLTGNYPTKTEPAGGIFIREHAKAIQLYNEVVVLHWAGVDKNLKKLWRLEPETDETLNKGMSTYRLWRRQLPIPRTSFLVYLWSVCQAFRQIKAQGFRPDIIHAHVYVSGIPAVIIGKLYHIPVVISEHWSAFPRKLLSRLEIFKARLAFKWAAMVMPVSYALQKAIESYGIRANFVIVPNTVNPTLFFPKSPITNRDNLKRILFVGLLTPIKGLPYLFQALKKVKKQREDWHLDIVGDGSSRAAYEKMTADLGILERVTFHGLKSKQEIAEFMRNCDFFVLPSLWENLPCVLIEAMASGLPIIATRVGGVPEIINQAHGILVPPKDVGALAKAIDYMLSHYQNYPPEKISQYAQENFSYKVVGRKLNDIYKQLLNI